MDVRHLRTFVMLAEELHFGRTATRLNTSQPVVSRTIKELEDDIGARLVERSARRVALTRSGQSFLLRAQTALESIAAGTREARAGVHGGAETIKLGVLVGTAQPFTGRLISELRRKHFGATISLHTLTERTLHAALVQREIDAAVLFQDCLPARLSRYELGRVQIDVFLEEHHPLAEQRVVEFDDLTDVPLVLPSPESHPMMFDFIKGIMRDRAIDPDVAVFADDILHMVCIAAAGAAVAIGPAHVGLQIPGVVRRPLMPLIETTCYLAWTGTGRSISALQEVLENI